MKKSLLFFAVILITAILASLSCNRDDLSLSKEADQFSMAENEAISDAVLQKIDDNIDKEISKLENMDFVVPATKGEEAGACNAKITVVTLANSKYPKTITLDYGTGCTDLEGNFRAGKIIVEISGPYWEKNTVRHSKLVDYYYNDLKIASERNEINKGKNENGYYVFEVKHSEKLWNTKNELIVDRTMNRVRTYNRGKDLTTNADDEVWVTGTTKVVKDGVEMVKEITKPLYRKLICQNFQSGVITSFLKNVKVGELNYGSGECDDIAIWTDKNGKTKEIKLKTWINYFSMKQ